MGARFSNTRLLLLQNKNLIRCGLCHEKLKRIYLILRKYMKVVIIPVHIFSFKKKDFARKLRTEPVQKCAAILTFIDFTEELFRNYVIKVVYST